MKADGEGRAESGCSPQPLGRIEVPCFLLLSSPPSLHPSVPSLRIPLHPVRGAWKLSQAMRDRGELGFISLAYVCQCAPARHRVSECVCVYVCPHAQEEIEKKKKTTKHCWLIITKEKCHAFLHVTMIQVVIQQTAFSKGDGSCRAWVRTKGRRRGQDRGVGEGDGEVEQSK